MNCESRYLVKAVFSKYACVRHSHGALAAIDLIVTVRSIGARSEGCANCFRKIKSLKEVNFKSGLFSQEAIIKILKMRKKISNAQLQSELVEILKNMFLPSKKMIKEQIEWLIEHKYMKRDEDNINLFIYMA